MKTVLTLLLFFASLSLSAQMTPAFHNLPHAANKKMVKDTTFESDTTNENKEPQYFYLTGGANIFDNTKGGAAKRFSP